MIRENKQQTRQKWYRFGVPVGNITVSLPVSLREVIKEEARRTNVSASALVTDLLMEKYGKRIGIEQDGGA